MASEATNSDQLCTMQCSDGKPLDTQIHPNTGADQVQPLMATILSDGSAPPAGQCALPTKNAQE